MLIFDDYLTGSFETKSGIDVSFYGFYSNLENGALVADGLSQKEANKSVDSFIKDSFGETWILSVYAYAMNVLTLVPFLALMLMVAALLIYSILKLRGIGSVASLGAMFKIIGSFVWFCGVISAVITVIIAFFVGRDVIGILPIVLFFVALLIRAVIFAIKESKLYIEQSEQQEA